MSPQVRKRPAAQRDLLEHCVALGERAGEATARRFLQAAEDTFAELAAMPGMGRAEDFDNPRFMGVRRWRVRDAERAKMKPETDAFFVSERCGPLSRKTA